MKLSAVLCRDEKRVAFKEQEDDGGEDDSGEAEDIHYKDFFDPAAAAPDTGALPLAPGAACFHAPSQANSKAVSCAP